METALKFKIKLSKNCTVTHEFLQLPMNYYLGQTKGLESKSVTVNCCLRSSLFTLGLDFLGPYRHVLAWMSFRKIYVVKESFSNNILQVIDINFPPTIS